MSQGPKISREEAERRVKAFEKFGISGGAKMLGIDRKSLALSIKNAEKFYGIVAKSPFIPAYKVTADHRVVPEQPRSEADEMARQAARQGWAPDFGLVHPVPEGMTSRGTSVKYDGSDRVMEYWNKTRPQGRTPDETAQLPDPKKIAKVATLYDQAGRVTQQWVTEKPDDAEREKVWMAFAAGLISEMPREPLIDGPCLHEDQLCTIYPIADLHLGMRAWKAETTEDYDLKIGEHLIVSALSHLIRSSPASGVALVAVLGDWLHYDSMVAETPTSKHHLDADGRAAKMIEVGIRAVRFAINSALAHHPRVHVIVEIGNHDLYSAVFLAQALSAIYEENSRVTVDVSPSYFHYFVHGECLIGTHHGHSVKMDQLPMIMAQDQREAWGNTRHRYWLTGHIHHRRAGKVVPMAQDFGGVSVESFRILPPPDAWAAQRGYRTISDMQSLVLHKRHGLVNRVIFNTAMLEGDDA